MAAIVAESARIPNQRVGEDPDINPDRMSCSGVAAVTHVRPWYITNPLALPKAALEFKGSLPLGLYPQIRYGLRLGAPGNPNPLVWVGKFLE
ncbi:hypothetical protein [Prochlorothrix hollandica]|uniref:hypothetical protein n=1 Tax=Prochlorothrix hollandica TaxID=1223 RepID=UPI003340113A